MVVIDTRTASQGFLRRAISNAPMAASRNVPASLGFIPRHRNSNRDQELNLDKQPARIIIGLLTIASNTWHEST